MNNENPNPKHKELLDVLPESLHHLVIPVLKTWDQRVNEQFANIHASYDDLKAFKPLVDNGIDPEYVEKAVVLADQLQRDAKGTIAQINQAWNLGLTLDAQPANNADEEFEFDDDTDIMNHPKVKALAQSVEQMQQQFESKTQQEQEAQALAEFEAEMDTFEAKCKEEGKPFNRMFVTALVSQGLEIDEAVTQYQQVLAGTVSVPDDAQQQTDDSGAPVVLGGTGNGSGVGEQPIDFGSMSKGSLNDAVAQLVQAQAESGQG